MYLIKANIRKELNKMSNMEKLCVATCGITSIIALCILAYVLIV